MSVTTADASLAQTQGAASDTRRVLLGCLLYTAGSAILYVLPEYLGELAGRLGLNAAQMGSITAAENIGIGLGSLLSMVWIGRIDLKLAAIGAAVACAGFNTLAFFSHGFAMLLAARFLTGFFGEGVLFALAFLVMHSTRNPERAFGFALTTVVTFGSLVLAATPYLNRLTAGSGSLLPLAIVPLVVLGVVRWLPQPRLASPTVHDAPTARGASAVGAIIALVAMAAWFAAPGGFWTFADSAADAKHIAAASSSAALAIGNTVGLLGSLIAAWLGSRWGRAWPIAIATIGLCLSMIGFEISRTALTLGIALSAFNIFWNYGAVYQMALVATLDPVGRLSMASSAAQVLGFAVGGFVAGLAAYHLGFGALTAVVCGLAVLGLALFAPCFRIAKA
jgi:predicted MFS family arabinose efflux permease